MGLDNGIAIKGVEKYPDFAPDGEIVYWRKCWNLRSAMLDVLDPERRKKDWDYEIEAEDVPAIIRAIIPFLSKDYWKENNSSIWEHEDMLPTLLENIENLIRLKIWWEEHPNAKVYFYDSY